MSFELLITFSASFIQALSECKLVELFYGRRVSVVGKRSLTFAVGLEFVDFKPFMVISIYLFGCPYSAALALFVGVFVELFVIQMICR